MSDDTFESRRSFRQKLLRLAIAVVGGLLLTIGVVGFDAARPFLTIIATWVDLVELIEAFKPREALLGLVKFASEPVAVKLRGWFEARPFLGPFAIGAGLAYWKGKKVSETIYSHAFEEYDTRILTPIRKAQPFDPLRGAVGVSADAVALPFINHGGTYRFMAFQELVAFARSETSRKLGWWPFCELQSPFGWAIVLGRSGTGKSRLAVQVARHLGLRGSDLIRGKRGLPAWTSWFRVQVLGSPPGPDDPWDTGWLRPTVKARSLKGREYLGYNDELALGSDSIWLNSLKRWRPARPTVLVLDDPRDEDAARVVETLEANMKSFAHPVRLIIVNQSAPDELRLRRVGERWVADGRRDPMIQPIILDDDGGRLDLIDLRFALSPHSAKGVRWASQLYESASLKRFLEVTGGEPLMIEIGFEWLAAGRQIDGVTRDSLIAQRTDRVLRALEDVGIADNGRLRALALATLASGGGAGPKHDIITAARSPEIPADQMALAFPAESVDFQSLIPPIRPEPVGDAFVERIYAQTEGDMPARLIVAGWRINPDAMLALALRCAGSKGPLADALASGPPTDLNLPWKKITLAYARAALVLPNGALPESVAGRRAIALQPPARLLIAKLSALDAYLLADDLLGLAEKLDFGIPFMGTTWFDLLVEALTRADQNSLDDDALDALTQRLAAAKMRHLGARFETEVMALVAQSLARLSRGEGDRGVRALRLRLRWQEQYRQRRNFFISSLLSTEPGVDLSESAINATAPDAQTARHDLRIQNVIVSAGLDTRTAVDRIEAIAMQFPEDQEIQYQRAAAWRNIAFYLFEDLAGCRAAVDRVEAIAAPFPADRDIQHERVVAWHNLAYALREDPAGCRAAGDRVEAIGAPFREDRGIQYERVTASRNLTYALRQDLAGCRAAVDRVEAIAEPFPEDREIQYQRAAAWKNVTYALMEDHAACRAAIDRVEAIGTPFPEDRDIQYERVVAWGNLAYALRKDLAGCRAAVDRVEAIAAPFPEDREIQYQRAAAWRSVTYALMEDHAACRAAIDRVEAIAAPFPADRDIQHERVVAWHNLAYALREDPAGCRAAVDRVEAIGAPFREDRGIQYERVAAWVNLAYALRRDPAGCRAAVDCVETIVSQFPDDRDFQYKFEVANNIATDRS